MGDPTRNPGAREPPVAHHGLRGNLQYMTGLFDAQPAKEAKLDDLSSSRIDPRQRVQRMVQRADLSAHLRARRWQIVEIDCGCMLRTICLPAAFDRRTRSRCID